MEGENQLIVEEIITAVIFVIMLVVALCLSFGG